MRPMLSYLSRSPLFDLKGFIGHYQDKDYFYGYPHPEKLAKEFGVPLLGIGPLRETVIKKIRSVKPQINIFAYYPHIISQDILNLPELKSVNVHPGSLPQYKGTFPTPWMILNGEKKMGVSVFVMNHQIDGGDILNQKYYRIKKEETGFELYQRSMVLSARLLKETLPKYTQGVIKPKPQKGEGSYYGYIPAYYHIDWEQPAEMIQRHVRVHAKPYFPAYTFLFNYLIAINRVSVKKIKRRKPEKPGTILNVSKDGTFTVACLKDAVRIIDYEIMPYPKRHDFRKYIKEGQCLN